MSHLTGASPGTLGFHEELFRLGLKEGLDGRCHPGVSDGAGARGCADFALRSTF